MKINPQIPIGKAMDNEQGSEEEEVSGHGLVFETGEPATRGRLELEDPAGHDDSENDGESPSPDSQ